MKKLLLIIILVAITFVWYGFQDGTVKETTYIENSSNLPPANLTGADLTGANLKGVNLGEGFLVSNISKKKNCKNPLHPPFFKNVIW